MSTRMGAPKHAIKLDDGRAMIEHVLDAMARVCEPVVFLASESKAQGWASMGFDGRIISDLRKGLGPLGGIEALLASGVSDEYIVCPCDVPRITSDVLAALLEPAAAHSSVLRVKGRSAAIPLPARVSAHALPMVSQFLDKGRRAVHHLHERLGAHIVEVPAEWEALLINVNTLEELEQLNKR